jgi:hypothetical protein
MRRAQTVMSSRVPRCWPSPLGADRGRSPSERARSLLFPAVTGRDVSWRVLSTTFGALATAAGAPPGEPTGGGTRGFGTCINKIYNMNSRKANKNKILIHIILHTFLFYLSKFYLIYDNFKFIENHPNYFLCLF